MGRNKRLKMKKITETNKVWDSGLSVIKPEICIHPDVLRISKTIQEKVKNNEFSVLFKGYWGEDVGFIVEPDFYIPKQKVSFSSVDYDEDLHPHKVKGYNTVIHSHPFSKNSVFSFADEDTINSNMDCSILFTNRFVEATLRVKIKDGIMLKIPVDENDIITASDSYNIPETELSKIKEKPIVNKWNKNKKKNKKDKVIMKDGEVTWEKINGTWMRTLDDFGMDADFDLYPL
jgi:hypothetical protein